jgi:uncharacterized protein (DUF4415 family)
MTRAKPPNRPAGTKAERLARDRLMRNLRGLQDKNTFDYSVRDAVPEAWATLEEDVDVEERKVKVTLLLDESVAKFFRAMGRGYQARINRILATYAQMKIARISALEEEMEREFPGSTGRKR